MYTDPIWLAVTIAGAELAYGYAKYAAAPTPEKRREAVEEWWGLGVGAVTVLAVALASAQAQSIAGEVASMAGVPLVTPSAGTVYTWFAQAATTWAAWYVFLLILTLAGSVKVNIGIFQAGIPGATIADLLNNYANWWAAAMTNTVMNYAGLFVIAVLYDYFVKRGIGVIGAGLLLPNRTRRVGAWLTATWLVLEVGAPALFGFALRYIVPHTVLGIPCPVAVPQNIGQWVEFIACFIAKLATFIATASLMLTDAFWLMVADIMLDVSLAIMVVSIAVLQDLIGRGYEAIIPRSV